MCGIAGIIGQSPRSRQEMYAMLAAIAHRGPDDQHVVSDDLAILGHRRLSVIDVTGGRQPISSADNSVHIICNGEIYNWKELRKPLEQDGCRFRTNSDTEVILHLYEKYGVDCLRYLRGMFAFAIWDGRRNRLFAARDHLGQKPFFYSTFNESLYFASEIKALTRVNPELRQMSLEAADQYLALRIICPVKTMFSGVMKLPPAHYLLYEPGGQPRTERYWNLDFSVKTIASESELLDELDALITDTLKHHMVSDVPVGALLSGGLDSSLIVAMLRRNLGVENLPTFTLGLPHKRFNEAMGARLLADSYRTDHHERTVLPSIAGLLPRLVYHLDEPTDPLSVCTWHVSKLARETVKVTLGGDGGDELFGGYDRYYGNLYAEHYSHIPRVIRDKVIGPLLRHAPDGHWYKSISHQAKWLHELSFLKNGSRYARSLSYFYFPPDRRRELYTDGVRAQLSATRAEQDIIDYYLAPQAAGAVDRMLYADYQSRLPDHPVLVSDRMSMAFGLETRSPFLDHRLVEFCARLPASYKIRGRTLRYLQLKLAARYLPEPLLRKPKQGFASALPYLLKDEYTKLFHGLMRDSWLIDDGVLRADPIEKMVRSHVAGQADHGSRLWLLVNLEAWYRVHIRQQGVSDLQGELLEAVGPGVRQPQSRPAAAPVSAQAAVPSSVTHGSDRAGHHRGRGTL
jgi:asparagine synthase (glutamine-hydrolysing)